MAIHWIIERDTIDAEMIAAMTDVLAREGYGHDVVKVVPFSHEIAGGAPKLPATTQVVCYGSIGLQDAAATEGWHPGVWTGPMLDETALISAFGALYLNHDGWTCRFRDLEPGALYPETFLKPNRDTKAFAGEVLRPDGFVAWRDAMLRSGYVEDTILDAEVLVAPAKEIGCEWRAFVVAGRIASLCCYRQYRRVMPSLWAPDGLTAFVEACIAIYDPLSAYAIDVTQVPDGSFRVLEINTMNNAGFYACDPGAVVSAINAMLA